jgi:hypothetical protein
MTQALASYSEAELELLLGFLRRARDIGVAAVERLKAGPPVQTDG